MLTLLNYFMRIQLHKWVLALEPQASEALLLASRAQHIGRWKYPRNNYPAGKSGYYVWRTDLAKYHAQTAGKLMLEAGYSEEEILPVQQIIRKENLRSSHDVQVMEDALCLVFLEFQFEDFLTRHDDTKMVRIIKRSWGKMSLAGRDAALKLSFSPAAQRLLHLALA